ncbi:beclin-1 [Aplysia californica]|uniref:Beclin-1 n=1 Tax=Aplysia californica TaxID=6500 RepID=A0ABM0JRN6_APLCA|nr:beclin-1 [Aplysia californica]XP_005099977.1 beclin-1 [Aplysia californica]
MDTKMSSSRIEAGKAGTTFVHFMCQRCNLPLKLDSSFSELSRDLFKELTEPLSAVSDMEESIQVIRKEEINFEEDEEFSRTIMPSGGFEESSDFTLVGDLGTGSMDALSIRARVTGQLFDLMSGYSEIDHPLCQECTDHLLDNLDYQLNIVEDENKEYREFLDKLGVSEDVINEEELDEELLQLREEEKILQQQLLEAEKERAKVAEAMEKEKEKAKQLDLEEEKYWKEFNDQSRLALDLEDEQRSVDNQLKYAQAQLDRLKKTNVFNATFHIWHDGEFGTINDFRLGRLPGTNVEWSEINAAWGQVVLLLVSLANKIGLNFTKYRPVPYGNHSYIEVLDEKKELPLYGSGGIRFLWDTKFDSAMVAFLECLQQFRDEVQKEDSSFNLPYKMSKGKIFEGEKTQYSIKMQFNSEEQWTKALKYMLTNLKWALAWLSARRSLGE